MARWLTPSWATHSVTTTCPTPRACLAARFDARSSRSAHASPNAAHYTRPATCPFLHKDELEPALNGKLEGETAAERASRRRAEQAWVLAHPGPLVVGPPPVPDLDLQGLPAAARRIMSGVLWAVGEELTPAESRHEEDGNLLGIGVSLLIGSVCQGRPQFDSTSITILQVLEKLQEFQPRPALLDEAQLFIVQHLLHEDRRPKIVGRVRPLRVGAERKVAVLERELPSRRSPSGQNTGTLSGSVVFHLLARCLKPPVERHQLLTDLPQASNDRRRERRPLSDELVIALRASIPFLT